MTRPEILDTWNARYFNGRLPERYLEALADLPMDREDVLAFLERSFGLMQRGGVEATDLTQFQLVVYGALMAPILPAAWSGRVPSITVPERHTCIDDFILNNRWRNAEPGLFLDLGCGFPPQTTLDSVKALEGWDILAADPSLPACVVYDQEQNYATFDSNGEIVYFQPAVPNVENWGALLSDRDATIKRFEDLRELLLPELGDMAEVHSNGLRIVDPIRLYSGDHLSFQVAGAGQVDVHDVDVVRCFNVLFYFDPAFRRESLAWFGNILKDGGLAIIGADWIYTTDARYTVYQKVDDQLIPREFAFSIDNLCSFTPLPWFTVDPDDHETLTLTELLRELRSHDQFKRRLYEVSDALRKAHDYWPRGEDGFYIEPESALEPADRHGRLRAISYALDKELASEAVKALASLGREAWINDLGHVAVQPALDR